jgi:hypothetical protein
LRLLGVHQGHQGREKRQERERRDTRGNHERGKRKPASPQQLRMRSVRLAAIDRWRRAEGHGLVTSLLKGFDGHGAGCPRKREQTSAKDRARLPAAHGSIEVYRIAPICTISTIGGGERIL